MDTLALENIYKEYEGQPLLNNVSFHVDSGEILCLLGSSGSGKSTILRIIAGIETPDRGSVLWNGAEVSKIPVHQRNFGLMFQDYALFPHLSVRDNVAFGLRMQRASREEIQSRVEGALARVNMAAFSQRRVTDLSGGEQQRIALARALAPAPRLLMLDEPLAALDRGLRVDLQAELRETLHRSGIPAIYVTHDQEEAIFLADRLALLHHGRIVQEGAPQEIYRLPANRWVAGFLAMGNLLPGRVGSLDPIVVETSCGEMRPLQPAAGGQLKRGDEATLLIRPSSLAASASPRDAGTVSGVVDENRFLGDHYRVRFRICAGQVLELVSLTPMRVGEKVVLNLREDEVILIPD